MPARRNMKKTMKKPIKKSMKKTIKRSNNLRGAGQARTKGNKQMKRSKVKKGSKRKLTAWNLYTKKVFADMKKKDKNAKFRDALKEASKTFKK